MASRLLKGVVSALGVVCATGFATGSQAAGFTTTAPLRGLCRPDLPPDPCVPFNLFGPPSISGDFVVWTNRRGPADGIWSYQISNRKIRKLAGLGAKVPGGRGRFTGFGSTGSEYPTLIGGETVVFFGRDKDNTIGVYTSSVRGGGVTMIANGQTPIPNGGGKLFKDLRWGSTNGTTVAFQGVDGDGETGIFKARIDGTELKTVIYSARTRLDARTPTGTAPGYYGSYSRPLVGAKFTQFYTSGLFDPFSGANAIFRANGGFVDLIDHLTQLDGGPTNQHVRIDTASAAETTNDLAVYADQPNTGFSGIFRSKTVDTTAAFVTSATKVPGVAANFSTFVSNDYGPGFGYDQSGLAFTGSYLDAGDGRQDVFFASNPGGKIVRVASGKTYYLPYVGDRSVSRGVIAFTERYNSVDTFYLATPKN